MSRKTQWLTLVSILAVVSMLSVACQPVGAPAGGAKPTDKLEMFSWWTAGGEADGLNAMYDIYKKAYPNVEIINAAVAGGAGTNAKAVLANRLLGGDPPDAFQLHAGLEVEKYDPTKYVQQLDSLYKSEGWEKVFPKDLISLLKYQTHFWGVPVNIHRANVMWYSKDVFDQNGLKPPTTWDEFFQVAEALKAKGIVPLVIGTKEGWEAGHTFETILVSVLGAEAYKGLWTGQTQWTDPKVTQALETYKKVIDPNTTLILSTDSDLFKYMKGIKP